MSNLTTQTDGTDETGAASAEVISGQNAAGASKARQNNMLVMALFGLDVVLGAAFGAAGFFLLDSIAIALAGAAFMTVGLVLMLVFQLVGRER